MAVLNKLLLVLVAVVLCVVMGSTIWTSHRRHMVTKYNGDGECAYLDRVGLLGSDGYEIILEDFLLNQEYKASYALKGVPVNNQVYDVALQVPDAEYSFKGLDSSILAMRLSDDTGRVYFDVTDEIKNYSHAYPPFHLYHYDPSSDPVFGTVDIKEGYEYTLDVHYIPQGVDNNIVLYGHFFLKTGGFK